MKFTLKPNANRFKVSSAHELLSGQQKSRFDTTKVSKDHFFIRRILT